MKNKKEKILFFTNELAIMLKSGLTFTTAIEIILKEEKDKNFKEVLKKIHKNLIAGKSIFERSTLMSKFKTKYQERMATIRKDENDIKENNQENNNE